MKPERTQTIWRLRVTYWKSKPTRAQEHARARASTHTDARTHTHALTHPRKSARTHTHTEYVTLIAFPRQQWSRERASMLHYTSLVFVVTVDIRTLQVPEFIHYVQTSLITTTCSLVFLALIKSV